MLFSSDISRLNGTEHNPLRVALPVKSLKLGLIGFVFFKIVIISLKSAKIGFVLHINGFSVLGAYCSVFVDCGRF